MKVRTWGRWSSPMCSVAPSSGVRTRSSRLGLARLVVRPVCVFEREPRGDRYLLRPWTARRTLAGDTALRPATRPRPGRRDLHRLRWRQRTARDSSPVPWPAGPSQETGASAVRASRAVHSIPAVAICTQIIPGPAASRPSGPVAACSVAGQSASMVMTIVAPRAAQAGLLATTAPSAR